jgi:NADPH:quinone reductase-like Zn-dependent oxidoreductase
MNAYVCDRHGSPEHIRPAELPRPEPTEDEILVRVHATTVTRTDCEIRRGRPLAARFLSGWRAPKWRVLGTEFSGVVVDVGWAEAEFNVGDEVFGVNAGLHADAFGAHAEYIRVREYSPVARKPDGVSFTDAAAVCDGALLALGCLQKAGVRKGTKLLVYGASGSIGTAAVQLGTHLGATVTAVCGPGAADLVRELGAVTVVDHTKEDITPAGQKYDVVFDAAGKLPFRRARRVITPGGSYLATDFLWNVVLSWTTRVMGSRRVVFPIPPRYTKKDVMFVKFLMEQGRYRAVIDRTYAFSEIVEAAEYVETGQKTGNVVLRVVEEA